MQLNPQTFLPSPSLEVNDHIEVIVDLHILTLINPPFPKHVYSQNVLM